MKLKLIKAHTQAKDTMSFLFEPERVVSWLAGQYFYFTLPKLSRPDTKGSTRHFTIYQSPTEGPNFGFTTRMREGSGYKQSLKDLKVGDIIEGEGPEGTFILDEHEKGEHVFLAGGIGITPFRSMLKYNIDKKLTDIKLHLIYANSTPEEIAFKDELETWEKQHKNIKVDMTVSEGNKNWKGLVGRIDAAMIKKLATNYNLQTTNFWLCGPPPMVSAVEEILGKMKISSGNVRSEKFTGY